jgi:hypothetical protein
MLSYFHVHSEKLIIQLNFQISTSKPHTVKCIHYKSTFSTDFTESHANRKLYEIVDDLCSKLCIYSEINQNEISLFSVISKLLLSLNGKSITQSFNGLQQWGFASKKLESAIIILPVQVESEVTAMKKNIFDLQIFLLRCAATSKSSATICTPTPPSNFWFGKNDGLTAQRILAVTNASLWDALHSSFSTPQQRQLNRGRKEMYGYLMSLPWTNQGRCTVMSNLTSSKTILTTSKWNGGTKFNVCLNLQDVIGDESPRLQKLSENRGTMTAYHGTNIENIWSILNFGLLNLSDTRFSKNGSMLGHGIYVSPSLRVAEFFAQSTTIHSRVFWQWYHNYRFQRNEKKNGTESQVIPWLDDLPIEVLDDYEVSCTAVVQARIIMPPTSSFGQSTNSGELGMINSNTDDRSTRRDGKYFVVPDSQDLRVTKLHLTFELQRKRKSFHWQMLAILVAMVVLFRIIQL